MTMAILWYGGYCFLCVVSGFISFIFHPIRSEAKRHLFSTPLCTRQRLYFHNKCVYFVFFCFKLYYFTNCITVVSVHHTSYSVRHFRYSIFRQKFNCASFAVDVAGHRSLCHSIRLCKDFICIKGSKNFYCYPALLMFIWNILLYIKNICRIYGWFSKL